MYQPQQQQQPQQMYSQNYGGGGPANASYPPPQGYDQPSAPPPYQPQAMSPHEIREQQYQVIVNKYEISRMFASRLQKLSAFKIVFVFDDSGSMNTPLEESPLNHGLLKATRWDELKYFSKISIDIANIFNQEGTDVYFLNRPMARNVRSPDDLVPYMVTPPNGYTPLTSVLGTVLNNNSGNFLGEKKLLVVIVTDGEPTDTGGRVDIAGFKRCLQSRGPNVFTTIVSCTDDDSTMDYLNNWDRVLPRLDVVDDYRSEKEEIIKVQGRGFSFTFGDYVVKSLLGSIDASLDNLDEKKVAGTTTESGCCTIL